jgi:hypothetical protein
MSVLQKYDTIVFQQLINEEVLNQLIKKNIQKV